MNKKTTLNACANLLHKGDPDRLRVAMAAPLYAREKLLPLYAFNLEVARAPWASQESMISLMRLQFWRDVLNDITAGNPPRPHEVATPLAQTLPPDLAQDLHPLISAREWDVSREPFTNETALWDYLNNTSGRLTWVACALLGADETQRDDIHTFGRASGLARFIQALPEFEKQGQQPINFSITPLCAQALDDMRATSHLRNTALLDGALAMPILKRATSHPLNPAYAAFRFALCRACPKHIWK